MQKHIQSGFAQTATGALGALPRKKSEYSLESKNRLESINRHKHDPHWAENFIASNLQPNYTEIQHDASFSETPN